VTVQTPNSRDLEKLSEAVKLPETDHPIGRQDGDVNNCHQEGMAHVRQSDHVGIPVEEVNSREVEKETVSSLLLCGLSPEEQAQLELETWKDAQKKEFKQMVNVDLVCE
jgi:hypothetical protein